MFRKRIGYNHRENQSLSAIRDLLLPKLMSGEIRLREAEEIVEAAQ
jgi:type I restriction enzyme S subunit